MEVNLEELVESYTLSSDEKKLIGQKAGANRIGFGVLFKIFQNQGRFVFDHGEVPKEVVQYVAKQIETDERLFDLYDFSARKARLHRTQVRELFGFVESSAADIKEISRSMTNDFPCDERESLKGELYERFFQRKLEPPRKATIDRLLNSIMKRRENKFFKNIERAVSLSAKLDIDAFIVNSAKAENDGEENERDFITFGDMRVITGSASVKAALSEARKLKTIRKIKLPNDFLKNVPQRLIIKYKRRVASEIITEIRRHPDHIKYALMTIFLWQKGRETADNLAEHLIQIIHKLGVRAEKKVCNELMNDFKKVSGKYGILLRIAEKSLDSPDDTVRKVIFPVAGEETLSSIVKELRNTATSYNSRVRTVMKASYSRHYRQILPEILDTLIFRSNNDAHKPVIDALTLVRKHMRGGSKYFPDDAIVPIYGVIKRKWESSIYENDCRGRKMISRVNYEICVLQTLREALRCKEIWIEGADKFRNPDEDLPKDFNEKRLVYYNDLNLSLDADSWINLLKSEMTKKLVKLNDSLLADDRVSIGERKGGKNILVSPFEAQPEPKNLVELKTEIVKRWPVTNLLDMLKEVDLRIGFTNHFQSTGMREILSRRDIQRRLLMIVFGLGTNTGLKPLANSKTSVDSYMDLIYAKRKFINKENLRSAIASVVNDILKIRREDVWGEVTTSCAADSRKFGAWDQNLVTEWHARYGGRGVMIYWHVERNSMCVYSQVKKCSSSEVAAMIEGLLRHCSNVDIKKSYVDSHGQSEVGFAFTRLLGFRLLPRFKDLSRKKLYLPNMEIRRRLGNLAPALTRNIKWDVIKNEYDQMVKYATAMKLGTADTESILRRFTRNNLTHPTYRGLLELGKVEKTIFLCDLLRIEDLRVEIGEGLNVIENWNSANKFVFYGKSGEISTNDFENQEISALCLHLLQNCMIYVNTLMIQHVLDCENWQDRMTIDDLRALTPLIYQHVNPYGNFDLDMNERIPLELGHSPVLF